MCFENKAFLVKFSWLRVVKFYLLHSDSLFLVNDFMKTIFTFLITSLLLFKAEIIITSVLSTPVTHLSRMFVYLVSVQKWGFS